jgi:3,4-dihydroxy 2-butanone 4-phosphate synthase/GTP cyclohydrolase II
MKKKKEQGKLNQDSLMESVLLALKRGEIVIVTDDLDRENEGDLIMAASKVTPRAVNFMARYGRGLICVPMRRERAEALGLRPMVERNREAMGTDFTVSVDAARGVTTGISAADRARTIRLLAASDARASDFVQPGHIFPLQARPGGVLQRAGHTEAAVDLMDLAGMTPVGVICEILNEDGTMARRKDLVRFQKDHGLLMCSIGDIVRYRRQRERLVECVSERLEKTRWGEFVVKVYRSKLDGQEHVALIKGEVDGEKPVWVRVHSESLLDDFFLAGEKGGTDLDVAMSRINQSKSGVFLYMRKGGCGAWIGGVVSSQKAAEQGERGGQNRGFRDYGLGAQILYDLGVRKLVLLTNHPKRVVALDGYGLELVKQEPLRL